LSAGFKSVTASIDAKLVKVKSVSASIDAKLQATFTVSASIDAVLQGAGTKFASIDALLAVPTHDNAPWSEAIGNNLSAPIDPNRGGVWSTYSRPSSPLDGQWGHNKQSGKVEYFDAKAGIWKNYDGSAA